MDISERQQQLYNFMVENYRNEWVSVSRILADSARDNEDELISDLDAMDRFYVEKRREWNRELGQYFVDYRAHCSVITRFDIPRIMYPSPMEDDELGDADLQQAAERGLFVRRGDGELVQVYLITFMVDDSIVNIDAHGALFNEDGLSVVVRGYSEVMKEVLEND